MNKTKLVYGAVFGLLVSVAGSANAAITSPTAVDFGFLFDPTPENTRNNDAYETVLSAGAYYGKANVDTGNAAVCSGGDCVQQNGMVIGTVADATGPNAHLHQGGTAANRALAYHNDSGGIYFRTNDASSFSLTSIKLSSPYANSNPYAKYLANGAVNPDYSESLDYWEIIGFKDAFNSDVASGDGTNYAGRVAYTTVYNGFNDILTFGSDFGDVKAVWLHYAGAQNVANAAWSFAMEIDNITVSAPVPVPAAVWMFGSGLLGLLSLGRRKPALSA